MDARISRLIYAAKGMAIVLVVLGHFDTPSSLPPEWQAIRRVIYSFHMPLFMMLSGLLMAAGEKPCRNSEDYKRFIMKKTRRLLIPYFSITTLILVSKWIAGHYFNLQYPLNEMLCYQVFLCPMGGCTTILWFIYTLYVIFLLYPIAKRTLKSDTLLWLISLVLFFFSWPEVFCLKQLFYHLPFFSFGILLFRRLSWVDYSRLKVFCISATATVSFGLCALYPNFLQPIRSFLMAMLGSISALSWSLLWVDSGTSFVSERLGYWASVIYLLHTLAMGPVKIFLYQITQWGDACFVFGLIAMTLAGILIPIALGKYIIRPSPLLSRLILGLAPHSP